MTADIQAGCDVLRPVWESTGGGDGYVSVEVSPDVANDTEATIAEARDWVKKVESPQPVTSRSRRHRRECPPFAG